MTQFTYRGPCVKCGTMDSREFTKKMCRSCYRKSTYVYREARKYTGPCTICGICNPEYKGRFFNKMCHSCYGRMKTTGNKIPRTKYNGPCINCGSLYSGSGSFVKGLCDSCYDKSRYTQKTYPPKQCIDCGCDINPKGKLGRCRKCHHKYEWHSNPEYRAKKNKTRQKYSKTLKGKITAQYHTVKRRSILARAETTLTKEEWKIILEKFDYRCAYCHKKTKLEMDHVIPITKGGSCTISNIVPACRSCNSSKHDGLPLVPIQTLML